MTPASLQQEQRTKLEKLIALHRVVFRMQPSHEFVAGERVCIGFDLELLGRRESHGRVARIAARWDQLATIAEAIRPTERRLSRYDLEGFDRRRDGLMGTRLAERRAHSQDASN